MAKIPSNRIQEILTDFTLLTDYIFGDVPRHLEQEVDQALGQSEELSNYVEDLLMITLTERLSKSDIQQSFAESKMRIIEWIARSYLLLDH